MPLHHSEDTHDRLVQRVPEITGRGLTEWFAEIEEGPAFLRFEERVSWLCSEYGVPSQHAGAILHEYYKMKGRPRIS